MTLKYLIALAAGLAAVEPVQAQSLTEPSLGNLRNDPGRAIAERLAVQIDADRNGLIDRAEIRSAATGALASIDADGDGRMTLAELEGWRYGMADLATFRDRGQSYATVIAFVFDIFDRDGDGIVASDEHEAAVLHSFAHADLDGDGMLTRDEYLGGFIFNVAMRNAVVEPEMRPQHSN